MVPSETAQALYIRLYKPIRAMLGRWKAGDGVLGSVGQGSPARLRRALCFWPVLMRHYIVSVKYRENQTRTRS